jgi:hypothetical protein
MPKVDIAEKLGQFEELWSPKIVARFNALRCSQRRRALSSSGSRDPRTSHRASRNSEHRRCRGPAHGPEGRDLEASVYLKCRYATLQVLRLQMVAHAAMN